MKRNRERGQSLVEFAYLLPVLLMILVILADLSRSIAAHVALSNATREGARFGAMHPSDVIGIKNRTLLEYNNSGLKVTGMALRFEDITIVYPHGTWDPGHPVRVEANCKFPLFLGSFFPESAVDEDGNLPLHGQAEMVIL
jgi:hypothetical protein